MKSQENLGTLYVVAVFVCLLAVYVSYQSIGLAIFMLIAICSASLVAYFGAKTDCKGKPLSLKEIHPLTSQGNSFTFQIIDLDERGVKLIKILEGNKEVENRLVAVADSEYNPDMVTEGEPVFTAKLTNDFRNKAVEYFLMPVKANKPAPIR